MRTTAAALVLGLTLLVGTASAAADFTLTVDPTAVAVDAGGSAGVQVSITQDPAAAQTVSLSVSGLPAGVQAGFDRATIDGSGATMLTLSADDAAPAAEAQVTVTATAGDIVHSATVDVTVRPAAQPDFTLAVAPAALSVVAGSSADTTVTVVAVDGFASAVALGVSGLPAGVTASFSGSITGSGTADLTLATSPSVASGTSTLTITGTSGALSHAATLNLTVTAAPQADFALAVGPSTLSVSAGTSSGVVVTVAAANGFSSGVVLSVSGLPTGVTASFTPSSIPGSGTSDLTFSASPSAPGGTSTVTVTGTSGALSHAATVDLTVVAAAHPDFTLAAQPPSVAVTQTGSTQATVVATPSGGFSSAIQFAVSGLPAGVSASLSPASVVGGGSTNVLFSASASAQPGTTIVTVTGTAASLTHAASIALTVEKLTSDFSLAVASPNLFITAGGSGATVVSTTLLSGPPANIVFSVSGLPAAMTATFVPDSATTGAAVSFVETAASSAINGSYVERVTATGAGVSRTVDVTVLVAGGETPVDLRFLIELVTPRQIHAHLENAARFAFQGAFASSCHQLALAGVEAPDLAGAIAGVQAEFGC